MSTDKRKEQFREKISDYRFKSTSRVRKVI